MGAITTNGLVGCWDAGSSKSYPGSGSTWTSIAENIVATWQGTEYDFIDQKTGYFRLNQDGTENSYAEVGTSAVGYDLVNITGTSISLFCWINRVNHADIGTAYLPLLAKRGSGTPQFTFNWYCASCYGTGGNPQLTFEIGGTPQRSNTADVLGWHHVGCTYDGSNVHFYLDGQPWGTTSYTPVIPSTTDSFKIGWDGNGAVEKAMADIGIVHVYNRPLTASEVKGNYVAQRGRFL